MAIDVPSRKSPHSDKSLGLWACRLWNNPRKSGQKNPTTDAADGVVAAKSTKSANDFDKAFSALCASLEDNGVALCQDVYQNGGQLESIEGNANERYDAVEGKSLQ